MVVAYRGDLVLHTLGVDSTSAFTPEMESWMWKKVVLVSHFGAQFAVEHNKLKKHSDVLAKALVACATRVALLYMSEANCLHVADLPEDILRANSDLTASESLLSKVNQKSLDVMKEDSVKGKWMWIIAPTHAQLGYSSLESNMQVSHPHTWLK